LCPLVTPATVHADRLVTRDALDRLEELLELRVDDGVLRPDELVPMVLVSAQPRYEESLASFPVQALALLTRVFGRSGVRVCEACTQVRTQVAGGRLEQSSGPVSLTDVAQLDERFRGDAAPARTATWIEETSSGVAMRIVDLRSAGVVFAQNVDPELREHRGSARNFRLAAELERRARGESLAHVFTDVALFPGQHVSLTWNDQWGATNSNLSGVVLSAYDPVLGIGASYDRVLPWWHVLVGAQVILSIPTAVAQGMTDSDEEIIDPIVTGVVKLRVPFGRSNFAGLLSVSTNGQVGLGVTLLNTSLIPVLP